MQYYFVSIILLKNINLHIIVAKISIHLKKISLNFNLLTFSMSVQRHFFQATATKFFQLVHYDEKQTSAT